MCVAVYMFVLCRAHIKVAKEGSDPINPDGSFNWFGVQCSVFVVDKTLILHVLVNCINNKQQTTNNEQRTTNKTHQSIRIYVLLLKVYQTTGVHACNERDSL